MKRPHTTVLDFVPRAPDYRVDWQGLHDSYAWVRRMRDCPQDPQWHAEGNVWIHTRMVLQELAALDSYRALDEDDQALVFVTALLHDVSKPDCTKTEPDGRISSRGHSRRGAILAREILWRMGLPFAFREHVANMVACHQVPYLLARRDDAQRIAIEMSQALRCDLLAVVTMADAKGRTCDDQSSIVDAVWYFEEMCKDWGVWGQAWAFDSDHARFLFARDRKRTHLTPAYDDCTGTVTVMSGLPGAGKSRWISLHASDLPQLSLDDIRLQLKVGPKENQGRVIQQAYASAKEFLRKGEPFVWNATNISADFRKRVVDQLAAYKARVRIVYVEVPCAQLFQQNRQREAVVPLKAIDKMLTRWTVPTLLEAHEVDYQVADASE